MLCVSIKVHFIPALNIHVTTYSCGPHALDSGGLILYIMGLILYIMGLILYIVGLMLYIMGASFSA